MPSERELQERLVDHLKGRNCQCPVCGTNNWNMCGDLVSPPCWDAEYRRPIEGRVLPLVVLICSECGFIRQFSALKLGLVS